ncbi:MAG: gamma-glutamyltransferase [Opitutaceae bacterium]|nr:gamma-glutamyltransferase [Opitutaceae bacterium]
MFIELTLNPRTLSLVLGSLIIFFSMLQSWADTQRPPLHARHWMAITGKPLGAMAGAKMFEQGGNSVDAACAMLAVVCTMHDDVGWGGETQALIYNPKTGKVIGINGLGVAPTGATPEFFLEKELKYPPREGPLAALTPGNPGALMVMLAEFGSLSLEQILAPAMEMADGFAIEEQLVNRISRNREKLEKWPYSKALFLPHADRKDSYPQPGEIFRQLDLLNTLRKLVETEQMAIRAGKDRKTAIMEAFDRFYKGDIGAEYSRGCQEQGGLITANDLANWTVKLEEPVSVNYKGIDVYKLTSWTQGPSLLQTLNILEGIELRPMGYNSARYIHNLYQALNLAMADRDFYYGDPYVEPEEPISGLLNKNYARKRRALIDPYQNTPDIKPGNPYEFQRGRNPFLDILENWSNIPQEPEKATTASRTSKSSGAAAFAAGESDLPPFFMGTTSIQAADNDGWFVSITPSGGWLPTCIAGNTGMGMSQRMQSFVLDPCENPYNVVAPGKQPRVTLTPTLALINNEPWMAFSVQGGDTQEQNLLQFFLNIVEFGMSVQESVEAANLTSYQMRSSFGDHKVEPGRLTLTNEVPSWVRKDLERMGYDLDFVERNSGPITAIARDLEHDTFWGAASNHGEDYGIGW